MTGKSYKNLETPNGIPGIEKKFGEIENIVDPIGNNRNNDNLRIYERLRLKENEIKERMAHPSLKKLENLKNQFVNMQPKNEQIML